MKWVSLDLSTKWLIIKSIEDGHPIMSEFVIPHSGLIPAPEVEQPNIFPLEWHSRDPKLAEIYERAKNEGYNPSALPWDTFDADAFTQDQRVAMMYWFALLSNFDASGPAVFAKAMIHAFEQHEEDPVRKCFFSITRDEMNHEETCGRAISKLVPGAPGRLGAAHRARTRRVQQHQVALSQRRPLLDRLFQFARQVSARDPVHLLHDGRGGVLDAVPWDVARVGASALPGHVQKIGLDESRHLQICITLLEKDWPGLSDEYRSFVTKQLRAGFVFLSMILWEPPGQFWDLPDYFLPNHRALLNIARKAGLGILSCR